MERAQKRSCLFWTSRDRWPCPFAIFQSWTSTSDFPHSWVSKHRNHSPETIHNPSSTIYFRPSHFLLPHPQTCSFPHQRAISNSPGSFGKWFNHILTFPLILSYHSFSALSFSLNSSYSTLCNKDLDNGSTSGIYPLSKKSVLNPVQLGSESLDLVKWQLHRV